MAVRGRSAAGRLGRPRCRAIHVDLWLARARPPRPALPVPRADRTARPALRLPTDVANFFFANCRANGFRYMWSHRGRFDRRNSSADDRPTPSRLCGAPKRPAPVSGCSEPRSNDPLNHVEPGCCCGTSDAGWRQFFISPDSKPALSAPPDPKMIRSRARTGTGNSGRPLFPKSRLPVFSLLFAFGEMI